jgi:hypothetical protein
VLAGVRTLSRLELVGESLRAAVEQLAQTAPKWLLPLVEPEWDKRYGRKVEIGKVPSGKAGVTAMAEAFGRDGPKVLQAAWAPDAPPRPRTLAQVEILRQVWVHHYVWDARGRLRRRDGHALPPASLRFDSPYDTDAPWSKTANSPPASTTTWRRGGRDGQQRQGVCRSGPRTTPLSPGPGSAARASAEPTASRKETRQRRSNSHSHSGEPGRRAASRPTAASAARLRTRAAMVAPTTTASGRSAVQMRTNGTPSGDDGLLPLRSTVRLT